MITKPDVINFMLNPQPVQPKKPKADEQRPAQAPAGAGKKKGNKFTDRPVKIDSIAHKLEDSVYRTTNPVSHYVFTLGLPIGLQVEDL